MPLDEFADYDEYWRKRGSQAAPIRRAEIISQCIEPWSTILDIGCGDGTLIDYVSKNNSPRKVMGIDFLKKRLNIQ